MKSIVLAVMCLIFSLNTFAQNTRWEINDSYPLRYQQIVDLSHRYFQNDNEQRDTSIIDKEIKRFNRWKWYWQGRVTETGDFPDLIEQNRVYKSLQFETKSKKMSYIRTSLK